MDLTISLADFQIYVKIAALINLTVLKNTLLLL